MSLHVFLTRRSPDFLTAPLALGHDVRAGGMAEAAWGAGRLLPQSTPPDGGDLPPLADLLFVPIGTGIAAAVVHGGSVFGDRFTGEIGQQDRKCTGLNYSS